MSLKKALLHIYGVRSIYNIVNVCTLKALRKQGSFHKNRLTVFWAPFYGLLQIKERNEEKTLTSTLFNRARKRSAN